MDADSAAAKAHEYKQKLRGIKGKLFTKDKRAAATQDGHATSDVSDFLYGPSDKLHMATPTPTTPTTSQHLPIVQVDTANARRWPLAQDISNSGVSRPRSASPRRSRKGLAVRFTDGRPEVIGLGGDESEEPTANISQRKRANSHPPSLHSTGQPPLLGDQQRILPPRYGRPPDNLEVPPNVEDFRPGPLQRTQTGYESINTTERSLPQSRIPIPSSDLPADSSSDGFLKSEPKDPYSFAARVQAEMRRDEGHALTRGASELLGRTLTDPATDPELLGLSHQMEQVQINTLRNSFISVSPNNTSHLQPGSQPDTPSRSPDVYSPSDYSPAISRSSTFTLQQAAVAGVDEPLREFSRRVAHLFTLFRLSTESVKPISVCSLDDLARIALWWFLKGRMDLETTIRDKPSGPEAQQYALFKRQQAHADLAKALWITEQVMPQRTDMSSQNDTERRMTDILEARQSILANLRKLTMSMQRNNFMPPDPDDAPLQQGLDPSIWVRDDGNRSLAANQKVTFTMGLMDAFPLGDTSHIFSYSRMFVDAILMEEDESQQYRTSCLVSVIRIRDETNMRLLIASVNGTINLCIQGDRAQGPTWEDVAWRTTVNAIDIKLPRGFVLRLQCGQYDFRSLWRIYDYENSVYASLFQHQDEELAFETTVHSFQNFDPSPQFQAFPKDPISSCQVRVFEKIASEKGAAGARKFHRGFRVAVVTGPKTKNLGGVNHELPSSLPIQFGFLRGEGGLPAFLLKINDGIKKSTMVFTFNDALERSAMHSRLSGIALLEGESIIAEAQLKAVAMTKPSEDVRLSSCMQLLEWQGIRIINEDEGDVQDNKTVLQDHLRIVIDFKSGTLTDRVNIGPGELKLRLDVNSPNELKVLRQPQQDMTISVSEAQVSKELPNELTEVLQSIARSETSRTYTFASPQELHLCQAALTGFKVLYDGIATSFNISRRRMVVPIYKKWDAARTRMQVVQREKVVQLVAFFENFGHGDCMNFTLKGTDIFESSGRSGKYTLRIVDAKFALPRAKSSDGDGSNATGMMDSAYVCLDMPDYPGEHDDITIIFDSEIEHQNFTQALPAPVKGASRLGSIKR